jgi:putative acetyltransferase
MSVCVRKAEESDRRAIADVVTAAFGPGEGPEIVQLIADLVADTSAQPVLSLVATTGDRVVGHVLFSRARVETEGRELSATILAPLAVDPEFQSRGIGGQLVMEGLRQLAEVGLDLVFVLGHPDYYPRFGFAEAGVRGFDAPYPIAAKNAGAWMVLALRPGILGAVQGTVRCADALDEPRYWRE